MTPASAGSLAVRWGTTSRAEGSFAVAPEIPSDPAASEPAAADPTRAERDRRWAALTGAPTTWLRQHHGTAVVRVREPGGGRGAAADAAVTAVPGAALAVVTADCAPVVLIGRRAVGVAHAGWRGLLDGVVECTVDALVDLGEDPTLIAAHVAPCIGPGHYEFGPVELDAVAGRYGDTVRARTATGRPALDLRAGVVAALAGRGVVAVSVDGRCTAADPGLYSWRARRDVGRQATWVVIG